MSIALPAPVIIILFKMDDRRLDIEIARVRKDTKQRIVSQSPIICSDAELFELKDPFESSKKTLVSITPVRMKNKRDCSPFRSSSQNLKSRIPLKTISEDEIQECN